MRRRAGLPTLPDAIDWLASVWEARDTPTRLHTREHEGWGLYFAPAFARELDAKPTDTAWITESRRCQHPRMVGENHWECPDCAGEGAYPATVLVYRYPLWRSLDSLRRSKRKPWRDAHDVVLNLVINGYSVPACARLGVGEGALLTAIRRLFDCYERAPEPRPTWTQKSESQQAAEVAA